MGLRSVAVALAASSVALAMPAVADEGAPEFTGRLTAGWAMPVGASSDYVQSGFSASAGFDWRPYPTSSWVLQGDLSWSRFNAEQRLVDLAQSATPDVQIDEGLVRAWGLTGGIKYYFPFSPSVKGHPLGAAFYALGGVGAYHREVEMTQTVLVTPLPANCDWFGYCYPGSPAAGDVLVYSKGTTKFGWNVGLGVEFPLESHQWWYIEARFHRIETTNATEFVPISVGVRF